MLLSYLCAKQKSLGFSLMEKSVLLNRSLVQRHTAKAKKRQFVTHILPSSPNYLLYISTRVRQDFNIYETWIVTAAVVDWTDALFPPSNTIYLEHANDPLAEKDMLYFSVLNPHYFLHSPHHHEVVFALLCTNVFLLLQQSQMLIQSHYLRPQSETNGHDLPCRIFFLQFTHFPQWSSLNWHCFLWGKRAYHTSLAKKRFQLKHTAFRAEP